ncbi:MAG: hypothetical protein J0I97_08120, partial [Microbacterium sp.]|nr:hypothetical protein [Microbacterium sp.]
MRKAEAPPAAAQSGGAKGPNDRYSKDNLIPIPAGPATIKPASASDPYAYWSDYYGKHDETADQ